MRRGDRHPPRSPSRVESTKRPARQLDTDCFWSGRGVTTLTHCVSKEVEQIVIHSFSWLCISWSFSDGGNGSYRASITSASTTSSTPCTTTSLPPKRSIMHSSTGSTACMQTEVWTPPLSSSWATTASEWMTSSRPPKGVSRSDYHSSLFVCPPPCNERDPTSPELYEPIGTHSSLTSTSTPRFSTSPADSTTHRLPHPRPRACFKSGRVWKNLLLTAREELPSSRSLWRERAQTWMCRPATAPVS